MFPTLVLGVYLPVCLVGYINSIKRGIIFCYCWVGSREPQYSSRDGLHAFYLLIFSGGDRDIYLYYYGYI